MIKYIETEEDKLINAGITDLDGVDVVIAHANGYGATDVLICCHSLTWEQVDILKKAIKMAEEKWRN